MLSISEGPGPSGRRFSRLSMGSGGRYLLPAGELVARDVLAPTGDRVQSGISACRIFSHAPCRMAFISASVIRFQ